MAMIRYLVAWALTVLTVASAAWVDYDRPSIYEKSNIYSLKVNGTYARTVNYKDYDYVHLSMDEGAATEFRIAAMSGATVTSHVISPGQLPIEATQTGNELVFSLKKAHYLIVKINSLKEFIIMIDPMEKNAPPAKGNGIFNALDYGADNTGGGITTGVQAAMDAAAKTPGSTVYVPPGLYYIGNLMLRSRTSLYLAGGAVLRFTAKKSDYKVLFTKSDLGDGTWFIQTEFDSTNIRVFGRGIIDGNGFNSKNASPHLIAHALVPVGTTNFQSDGILVRDASFWAVVPIQSSNVTLTNLKILNRFDIVQNDGVDACESSNVLVSRSIAVANDDSYSAKTWPDDVGTTVPYPYPPRGLSDVLFEDCLAWTLCFGYKIGQGVFQEQNGVTFRNSAVYKAGVGLGIHHKFGSAAAKNIRFENIDVERLGGTPAGVGAWFAAFVQDSGNGTGPVEDVTVKNVHARAWGKTGGKLVGQGPSALVDGVTFTDIFMLANTTAAKTLEAMDIRDYDRDTANIKITNS